MPLDKPIDALTEADIQGLIDDPYPEGKFIDYKIRINLEFPAAKDEFRRDISSFANSAGGHIIYGVDEKEKYPTEIVGLSTGGSDERFLQSIQSVYRTAHITPRIIGIQSALIPIAGKGPVLVIRIPKSYATHQITTTHQGPNYEFWSRDSSDKVRMQVDDLEAAFTFSATLGERIRSFRANRIAEILQKRAPVPLSNSALVVLHLIPMNAFEVGQNYDMQAVYQSYRSNLVLLHRQLHGQLRYNFDGILASDFDSHTNSAYSYVQIYRNGIIEAVDAYLLNFLEDETHEVIPYGYEEFVRNSFPDMLQLQEFVGARPPILVMMSILDVKGRRIKMPHNFGYRYTEKIDRSTLILPETRIDSFDVDRDTVLRPMFDMIWNAAGWPRSQHYDSQGVWVDSEVAIRIS
jgi:hypothetical protein